jgi:hypothetical protein
MSTCLSDYALDGLILDDSGSGEALAHLQICEACRRRREERVAFAQEFERVEADNFWKRVRRGYQRRRRHRWVLGLALPSVLTVGCVMTVLLVRQDGAPLGAYLGAKGSSSMEIRCRRAGRTFAVHSQDSVQAGDELRFIPRPSSSAFRYIQVASIDGTGRYSPFYPSDLRAYSLPLPSPGDPLAGSIRLDGALGPERLFFVYSSVPLSVPVVEQAARAQAADMHAARNIGGAESESGWIFLPKTVVPSEPR